MTKEFLHDDPIPAGFTACPWCPASGPPNFMNGHMKRHEDGDLAKLIPFAQVRDKSILQEIADERVRQDEKWGEQNHPDGTNAKWSTIADGMKAKCESKASRGQLTWRDIFEEEIWEAYGEVDPELLRAELVQAAAVLVNWIGAIDRRKANDRNCDSGE